MSSSSDVDCYVIDDSTDEDVHLPPATPNTDWYDPFGTEDEAAGVYLGRGPEWPPPPVPSSLPDSAAPHALHALHGPRQIPAVAEGAAAAMVSPRWPATVESDPTPAAPPPPELPRRSFIVSTGTNTHESFVGAEPSAAEASDLGGLLSALMYGVGRLSRSSIRHPPASARDAAATLRAPSELTEPSRGASAGLWQKSVLSAFLAEQWQRTSEVQGLVKDLKRLKSERLFSVSQSQRRQAQAQTHTLAPLRAPGPGSGGADAVGADGDDANVAASATAEPAWVVPLRNTLARLIQAAPLAEGSAAQPSFRMSPTHQPADVVDGCLNADPAHGDVPPRHVPAKRPRRSASRDSAGRDDADENGPCRTGGSNEFPPNSCSSRSSSGRSDVESITGKANGGGRFELQGPTWFPSSGAGGAEPTATPGPGDVFDERTMRLLSECRVVLRRERHATGVLPLYEELLKLRNSLSESLKKEQCALTMALRAHEELFAHTIVECRAELDAQKYRVFVDNQRGDEALDALEAKLARLRHLEAQIGDVQAALSTHATPRADGTTTSAAWATRESSAVEATPPSQGHIAREVLRAFQAQSDDQRRRVAELEAQVEVLEAKCAHATSALQAAQALAAAKERPVVSPRESPLLVPVSPLGDGAVRASMNPLQVNATLLAELQTTFESRVESIQERLLHMFGWELKLDRDAHGRRTVAALWEPTSGTVCALTREERLQYCLSDQGLDDGDAAVHAPQLAEASCLPVRIARATLAIHEVLRQRLVRQEAVAAAAALEAAQQEQQREEVEEKEEGPCGVARDLGLLEAAAEAGPELTATPPQSPTAPPREVEEGAAQQSEDLRDAGAREGVEQPLDGAEHHEGNEGDLPETSPTDEGAAVDEQPSHAEPASAVDAAADVNEATAVDVGDEATATSEAPEPEPAPVAVAMIAEEVAPTADEVPAVPQQLVTAHEGDHPSKGPSSRSSVATEPDTPTEVSCSAAESA